MDPVSVVLMCNVLALTVCLHVLLGFSEGLPNRWSAVVTCANRAWVILILTTLDVCTCVVYATCFMWYHGSELCNGKWGGYLKIACWFDLIWMVHIGKVLLENWGRATFSEGMCSLPISFCCISFKKTYCVLKIKRTFVELKSKPIMTLLWESTENSTIFLRWNKHKVYHLNTLTCMHALVAFRAFVF